MDQRSVNSSQGPTARYVYKILPAAPPDQLPAALPLSQLDQDSGYIHLSTAAQTRATAARFFGHCARLWFLKVDLDRFVGNNNNNNDNNHDNDNKASAAKGKVIWEVVPEVEGPNNVFPHLYDGDLGRDVVVDVIVADRDSNDETGTWDEVVARLGLQDR